MADLAKTINGVIRSCKLEEADRELVEQAAVDNCTALLGNYDWKFMRAEASTVSVADETDYTLSALAGHIEYVEYNTVPLSFLTETRWDELRVNSHTGMGVVAWREKELSSSGSPVIQLLNAPPEAGKTIFYRYIKKIDENDPFALLPASMMAIVTQMLMAQFSTDGQKAVNASFKERRLLSSALWRWRNTARGVMPYTVDAEKRRRNVEINVYRGYGRNFASGILRRG